MIDLHTHTFHSDGALGPSELAARAFAKGYEGLAITDHADSSNIADIAGKLRAFASNLPADAGIKVAAGIELTHVPPSQIKTLCEKGRGLGLGLVVCHGETIVEPVMKGTNIAAIAAGVDILAHPGLVTEEECRLAKKNSVFFEITARKGHSLTNGHVAAMAGKYGVGLVLNTDAHSPEDLITDEFALNIALGAGLTEAEFERMRENARILFEKAL
ncbi:MAG: histidinol phosphate phosphatase domain-containing protein [Thermodesulfobacteriota bacterium]